MPADPDDLTGYALWLEEKKKKKKKRKRETHKKQGSISSRRSVAQSQL